MLTTSRPALGSRGLPPWLAVPYAPVFPPLPSEDDGPAPAADMPPPLYCPHTHLPQTGLDDWPLWLDAVGGRRGGHGPGARHETGTARDRSTPVPDSNLTGQEPTPSDLLAPKEPGSIAPDSRPVSDHNLLDGTRQGPAQPQ